MIIRKSQLLYTRSSAQRIKPCIYDKARALGMSNNKPIGWSTEATLDQEGSRVKDFSL